MDKKHKQNLITTIISSLVVIATLIFMYDDFAFQTYGNVVYYDYILEGEDDQVKIENLEVYRDKKSFFLGQGKIIFKEQTLLVDNIVPEIKVALKGDDKTVFEYPIILNNFSAANLVYPIDQITKKSKKVKMNDLNSAVLTISKNNQEMTKLNVKIKPVEQLEGSNKDYRIENASVSDTMMHLGALKTTEQEIIKKYPTVSLEYRYLKDENGEKDDNDNYIVFKKITGKSSELVNAKDYGIHYLDEDSFKDKDLSVVIIFSNDNDRFAFAIDLKTKEVGDYYG